MKTKLTPIITTYSDDVIHSRQEAVKDTVNNLKGNIVKLELHACIECNKKYKFLTGDNKCVNCINKEALKNFTKKPSVYSDFIEPMVKKIMVTSRKESKSKEDGYCGTDPFNFGESNIIAAIKFINNQNTNPMNQEDFIKLVKKEKSAKSLAIAFVKQDYDIKAKEIELKELQTKLLYYQSLNSITGKQAMEREKALEIKRVKARNKDIQIEIDRVVEIKANIDKFCIKPYEIILKGEINVLRVRLTEYINQLLTSKSEPLFEDELYKFLYYNIDKLKDEMNACEVTIERLLKNQECNNHLVEVIKAAF